MWQDYGYEQTQGSTMITPGSQWVSVVSQGANPYVNTYNNQPLVGMVRYNASLSCLEIYDGSTWHARNDNAMVDLSQDAKELLEWARQQRARQAKIDQLMERHPGLKDLHERFEVMLRLVQEEHNDPR
jgi:exonuclease I